MALSAKPTTPQPSLDSGALPKPWPKKGRRETSEPTASLPLLAHA